MILDKQMEFSNAQAVTVTAASSNQLDMGPAGPGGNSGGEADMFHFPIVLNVDTTFTAGGAATLQCQLRSSPNANMSSPTIHQSSDLIPVASLVAGSRFPWKPSIPADCKRYVDINYIVATGPMTAGAISARGATSRQSAN